MSPPRVHSWCCGGDSVDLSEWCTGDGKTWRDYCLRYISTQRTTAQMLLMGVDEDLPDVRDFAFLDREQDFLKL